MMQILLTKPREAAHNYASCADSLSVEKPDRIDISDFHLPY